MSVDRHTRANERIFVADILIPYESQSLCFVTPTMVDGNYTYNFGKE